MAYKYCSIEVVGSSVKIDETWSIEVLRVVAFSQGVVAPFQERLVNESGGWSSLPGEAGKRAQVGAYMLVGVCTSTYVVRCFLYNKILKVETTAPVVFSRLGFPPKILVFRCVAYV